MAEVTPQPRVQQIELERKFIVNDDSENKILAIGAEFLAAEKFYDDYYDNDRYALTLADCWLRKRDNRWQCKHVPNQVGVERDSLTSRYDESDEESEILAIISTILKVPVESGENLTAYVDRARCAEFARIGTERRSFGYETFTIVLDETDFGFKVGEIERIVVNADRIPDVLSDIDELASKLVEIVLTLKEVAVIIRTRRDMVRNTDFNF
ncbi:thiamine-triphosphatase-like isoform X2 [Tubulanus polymorphus]|uniref:thiamine-triphosphatase-like isoform X2 n=1 Tax=Tubulanus polymorphus TaxID=672921 RepID=UPI003DA321C1